MDTKDGLNIAADYVRDERTKGKSEEEIEAELRASGWTAPTLTVLWQHMEAQDPSPGAPKPPPGLLAASAEPSGELFTNPIDSYEMALVPAGKAIFGSADDDPNAKDSEKPQFEAELDGFYLGLYCVTNRQYAAFLNAVQPAKNDREKWIFLLECECHVVEGGAGYSVDDDDPYGVHPVVYVSWYGAQAYCEWSGLRLPSELEWEKGARGPDGQKYPWGDEWDENMCRHYGNRGGGTTCVVWDYPEGVSRYGLYNIDGNVREWCADWYDENVYRRYAGGDLRPPESGDDRVQRGGSWDDSDPRHFRCAYRYHFIALGHRGYDCRFGLRCARGL